MKNTSLSAFLHAKLPPPPARLLTAAFAAVFAAAFSPGALAQAPLPTAFGTPASSSKPAPAPAPAPSANNNVSAGTAGDYRSSTAEGGADRLFNVNSDSVDFENGSFQWKGRTFNLGNSRLMRARLEKYLSTPPPPASEGKRYEQLLRRIEDLLAPSKITPQNYVKNVQQAWELLDEAAAFEGDGDNCRTISTLVHKTARMRQELGALSNERMRQKFRKDTALRKKTEFEEWREDNKDAASGSGGTTTSNKGGTTTKTRPPPTRGTARSAEMQEKLAEERKELGAIDTSISGIGLKSRVEFQSQIVAFLLQRRFHHAIIASGFYRQIFPGRDQELKTGQKQIKEMFPISDFVPTIDSVDMLAREAINDVDTGIKAITTLYDSGERFGAFERMQETFFLGEHEPSLVYYDLEKKRTLREIWSTARELQRLGDERDLAACEGAIKKIRAVAEDFPSAQILSKVNGAKQASDLEIFAAESAMFQKDTEGVKTHLTAAAKIWPTNPALNDFARRVRERTNQLALMTPEFDRLLAEGSHRSIYNKKQDFAVALLSDEGRAQKLKELVERLGKIDAILLQARTFHRQRNTFPAWDLVQEAANLEATDPEVSKARAELAPAAADYTRLLNQAETSEREGNPAVALAAMLAAQELNQGSELCRLAIQRLSLALMSTL